MVCDHNDCSFKTVQRFPELIEVVDRLDPDDVLQYGTSDPTTNPCEVWLTHLVAERFHLKKWRFFNYPRSQFWIRQDVEFLFAPYGYPYDDPRDAVLSMGLQNGSADKLELVRLQEGLDDSILRTTLHDIAEHIKQHRPTDNRGFVVANIIDPDNPQGTIAIRRRKRGRLGKLYLEEFRTKTIGDLLSDYNVKIGGAIVYFLFGYQAARRGLVALLPHNLRGEVWSSLAMGVEKAANGRIRAYPVGGIDAMTRKQWHEWQQDRLWRKAPTETIVALEKDTAFKERAVRRLLDEKAYAPIMHDEESRKFSFFE